MVTYSCIFCPDRRLGVEYSVGSTATGAVFIQSLLNDCLLTREWVRPAPREYPEGTRHTPSSVTRARYTAVFQCYQIRAGEKVMGQPLSLVDNTSGLHCKTGILLCTASRRYAGAYHLHPPFFLVSDGKYIGVFNWAPESQLCRTPHCLSGCEAVRSIKYIYLQCFILAQVLVWDTPKYRLVNVKE